MQSDVNGIAVFKSDETLMNHTYYSHRKGTCPSLLGLSLGDTIDIFLRMFAQLQRDGYFDESFGFYCVDSGHIDGSISDVDLEILLTIRKKNLWPIDKMAHSYSEDDFFDILEFLYRHVSKPTKGWYHSWNDCGMHWEEFDRDKGKVEFREKVNIVLSHYENPFELSINGEVLSKPETGFEAIFEADIPSKDANIRSRVESATLRFRRHGSTLDDRRQAVRDLVDVLECIRPKVKSLLSKADDRDLFEIANNFGIRHLNDKQKTGYDAAIWLSWMFYFYLATVHVVLRKIEQAELDD
jgi:hypothetical protein